MKRMSAIVYPAVWLGFMLLSTSCTNMPWSQPDSTESSTQSDYPVHSLPSHHSKNKKSGQDKPPEYGLAQAPEARRPEPEAAIYPGTGTFVNTAAASAGQTPHPGEGDIVLNFQNASIEEVAKVILGNMLQVNYVVDTEVKGSVNLKTSSAIDTDSLLPLFEKLLQMNGASLLEENSLFRIVPRSKAPKGSGPPRLARLSKTIKPGFQTYVVPLRYITAEEMKIILQPFLTDGAILNIDNRRNLLILSGTSDELHNWLETISIFDVDWMKGNSVALFPVENVEPEIIIDEIRQILGTDRENGLPSMLRLEPINRLNAILAITPQLHHLKKVEKWVERLDRAQAGPGIRLYVYRVKNRKATELADVLSSMFAGTDSVGTDVATLRPGSRPATVRSSDAKTLPKVGSEGGNETYSGKDNAAVRNTIDMIGQVTRSGASDSGLTLPHSTSIKVIADEPNNSLVIMANSSDYRIVEAALDKLDINPLQVLIEASIVEVQLTDDLEYGVEWFFKNNNSIQNKTGVGTLDLGAPGIGAKIPGFSYAIIDLADQVHFVLNMLANESKLNVLSSPSLMVLDNRSAEIRVGNQVPVQTETAVTDGGVTVESIQFKDTGVLLQVTPGVNSSGLVTMDVTQEVTDVGPIDPATGQRTFLQRNIKSVVAVQSGETIVLGGLILENESRAKSGIPGLHTLPGIGNLFGQTDNTSFKTELLVLLTPKVIRNNDDALEITDELRERMKDLEKWPFESPLSRTPEDAPEMDDSKNRSVAPDLSATPIYTREQS